MTRLPTRLVAYLCALTLQFVATDALAWGDEGHEIVGLIAEHYLAPAVRQKVAAILAQDKSGLAASDTGDVLADESTWADKYRDADNRRLHYIATRNWHFVDLEVSGADMNAACFGRPALSAGTPASSGPADDCAIDKIEQFQSELANPSTPGPERLMALQFILHFVGDLHQPLHASDDHDRGGNSKPVTSRDFGAGNLHGFWDTQFVQALGRDPRRVASALIARIAPAEKTAWEAGTPDQWAMESYAVSKQIAYGALPKPDDAGEYALTGSYEAMAKTAVAGQLSRAGVRLAAVLDRALQGDGLLIGARTKSTQLAFCGGLAPATAACSPAPAVHPGTIAPGQAASHVGETETVEGIVSEVHTARSGRVTFIDMGGEYPNNTFTGVIFASAMGTVGDVSDLAGKTVDISGPVRLYRGRSEIIVESRDQIRVR